MHNFVKFLQADKQSFKVSNPLLAEIGVPIWQRRKLDALPHKLLVIQNVAAMSASAKKLWHNIMQVLSAYNVHLHIVDITDCAHIKLDNYARLILMNEAKELFAANFKNAALLDAEQNKLLSIASMDEILLKPLIKKQLLQQLTAILTSE